MVNISTEVAQGDVYMVMQDDYVLGQMMADRLAEVVGEEGGQGVIIAGPANATWSRKRTLGFSDQVAAEYPNIEIVAAPTQLVDPAEGLASFEDAVQRSRTSTGSLLSTTSSQPSALPAEYQGEIPYELWVRTGQQRRSKRARSTRSLPSSPSPWVGSESARLSRFSTARSSRRSTVFPHPCSRSRRSTPVADNELIEEG